MKLIKLTKGKSAFDNEETELIEISKKTVILDDDVQEEFERELD